VFEFVRQTLVKAGIPEPEAERLANFYLLVREGLHGRAFYGADYEPKCTAPLRKGSRLPATGGQALGFAPAWEVEHE
jgi:hypothetical protein